MNAFANFPISSLDFSESCISPSLASGEKSSVFATLRLDMLDANCIACSVSLFNGLVNFFTKIKTIIILIRRIIKTISICLLMMIFAGNFISSL